MDSWPVDGASGPGFQQPNPVRAIVQRGSHGGVLDIFNNLKAQADYCTHNQAMPRAAHRREGPEDKEHTEGFSNLLWPRTTEG